MRAVGTMRLRFENPLAVSANFRQRFAKIGKAEALPGRLIGERADAVTPPLLAELNMKTSSEGAGDFQNRLFPIGPRPSGMVESLELRDVVSGMKRELHCLLRQNIRLELSDTSDAGYGVKALRRDIEDLIRHLVLDARDAMPAGGELCILTSKVALDAEYTRTHWEVPQGNYAMLAIRDTGNGSNAESLKALKRKAVIRKGRSLGLTACYKVIDQLGGHLCVSRHAHETVIKVYLPHAGGMMTGR